MTRKRGEDAESKWLSRAELEADHVGAGVAKWGEAERAGLEEQARAKSLETLRAEYDLRHSLDPQAALAASMQRQSRRSVQYPAPGCLSDGPS